MTDTPSASSRIALIGLGTVGLGWAANYLAKGFEVCAFDPAPQATDSARDFMTRTWPALLSLGLTQGREWPSDRLNVVGTSAEAVRGACFIHENGPEDAKIKHAILTDVEQHAAADAIIASSSGGLPPSSLQIGMRHPERFMIAHPFNPPHLIPLVEVLGGKATDAGVVDKAIAHLRAIGKHPIKLDREMPGYLTNRLQFALVREAVNCLVEGVASAESIEDAVRYGLAPRWLAMGSLTTLTLAGGTGGMPRVMDSFANAIQSWWDSLGTPNLTDDVKAELIRAANEITQGRDLKQLIAQRDKSLVTALCAVAALDKNLGRAP
jgi:carnitine 3-dehydrogenase